jgi:hypothetical protein
MPQEFAAFMGIDSVVDMLPESTCKLFTSCATYDVAQNRRVAGAGL